MDIVNVYIHTKHLGTQCFIAEENETVHTYMYIHTYMYRAGREGL